MVKISVKVKPGSKQNLVERRTGEDHYIVRVKEKAVEGRANAAVIGLISDHFKVPKKRVSIIRGFKGKNKLMEIL
ncbi:MAG: DUF167 domain-containing protein [Candidatus Omnitrophota bacterium]|nr:DUF167 domain-containing protein [Candidatus Omnitrophota bacterium]